MNVDFPTILQIRGEAHDRTYFQRGEEMPEFLFTEKSGRRVEYSRFAKAWKKAQKLAGMGRMRTPHVLRHGWASQMIAAGEDIASVSKHLGHANVGITLSIYVHFLPKKKRLPGNILDRNVSKELAASGQV